MIDPLQSIRSEALAVGMKAKCNDLPAQDVDIMVTRAEETLSRDDPLFLAITTFAVRYEVERYIAASMAEMGEDLTHAVRMHCLPDVPDANRVDIHG